MASPDDKTSPPSRRGEITGPEEEENRRGFVDEAEREMMRDLHEGFR